MLKEGLAACSIDMLGCVCRDLPSFDGGWTGGGKRGRPSDSIESVSSRLAPVMEEAPEVVEGLASCLVRDGSSFTGGVGADGSSNPVTAPNGPRGSSVTDSNVVDCAIVLPPYRLGARVDLTGAGFALEVGAGLSSAGTEGVEVSVL